MTMEREAKEAKTDSAAQSGSGGFTTRPVPDPTLLTTQQLQRELLSLRELMESRIKPIEDDVEILRSHQEKGPDRTAIEVGHLKELCFEKFAGVNVRFLERDVRIEQTSKDNKTAITAAFDAAKEAVSKSETNFSKQIDQQGVLVKEIRDGLTSKIDGVKDRVTTIEGNTAGIVGIKNDNHSTNALTISIIAVVATILGMLSGLLIAFIKH